MVMILDLVEPDMVIVSIHVMLEEDVIIPGVRLFGTFMKLLWRYFIFESLFVRSNEKEL